MYDLPFGENHRLASKARWRMLEWMAVERKRDNWVGILFHSNVRGGSVDIGPRGQRPRARESRSGASISLSDRHFAGSGSIPPRFARPTTFTTCVNPAGSAFANAGRFIIEGPGQFLAQQALTRPSNSRIALTGFANSGPTMFLNRAIHRLNTNRKLAGLCEVTSAATMRPHHICRAFSGFRGRELNVNSKSPGYASAVALMLELAVSQPGTAGTRAASPAAAAAQAPQAIRATTELVLVNVVLG